jgi:hypothetical protein
LSVDADHDKETLVEVTPLEARFVGALGGVVSEGGGVAVVVGSVVVGSVVLGSVVVVVVVVESVAVVVVMSVAAAVVVSVAVVGGAVVVVCVVVVFAVVVVVGVVAVAVNPGTRTVALKFLFIVSGGSTRRTPWIRFARTVMLHSVPGASLRFALSVYLDAGEELSENACGRAAGHASVNDPAVARTRLLKRMETTPPADIESDTTRGGASADADDWTSPVNQDAPPATETARPSPSGADSKRTSTLHPRCKSPSLTT